MAGVDAFKIEGRMKSAEYVGAVVSAYRLMLDNYEKDGEKAMLKAKAILQSDFARRKTSFLYLASPRTTFTLSNLEVQALPLEEFAMPEPSMQALGLNEQPRRPG